MEFRPEFCSRMVDKVMQACIVFAFIFMTSILHAQSNIAAAKQIPDSTQLRIYLLQSDQAVLKNNLPPINYNKAFFCRIENEANKKRKMPVYFRLGNKDYVDYMESKKK